MAVTSLPQAIEKGDLSLQGHQAGRGRRHPAGHPPGGPALGLSRRHRDPGAGHRGQDESGARRGGAAVLEVRGHRALRHRNVPVRQPVRRDVAGRRPSASPAWATRCRASRSGWPIPIWRRSIGEALEKRLGYPYRALDWQTQNASLFSALQLEKLAMGLIIFFIMVVAAFNIVGTLTMVVTDKTKEIGILRAMGLTSPAVARIFLIQGAVIGVVGTLVGPAARPRRGLRRGRVGLDQDQSRRSTSSITCRCTSSRWMSPSWWGRASRSRCWPRVYPSRTAAGLTPVEAIRHE